MKAFITKNYGKKEKQYFTHREKPTVKDYEVLIQTHAVAVNVIDLMIRNGEFKLLLPIKPPFILGRDVAGVVTQIGSKVSKFNIGDEVYSSVGNHKTGTYAEYITVHENEVALKPKNLSMEEAASVPLVGLTAWQALVEVANIQKGQKVFIQAGSGGVGTLAIQLAKYLGAYVATTTSTKNMELVKSLGADLVIDYKTQDFEAMIEDYDLVIHSNKDVKVLEKSLRVLKSGGQVISLVGPPTREFAEIIGAPWYLKFVLGLIGLRVRKLAKKLNTRYSFLFMRASGKQLEEITELIEGGFIKPVMDKVFPFNQTNEALEYVETGRSKGKVVITMKN